MAKCRIVCLHCRKEFSSPIQFGNAQAFFTSTLIGNSVQCPSCRKLTSCNKENMKFVAEDEGFVGSDT